MVQKPAFDKLWGASPLTSMGAARTLGLTPGHTGCIVQTYISGFAAAPV
jgi:hypothetical protein